MGKLKDQFNRLMRPAAGKQNKATDDRSVISASKSLTDSAEQAMPSLSKKYRCATRRLSALCMKQIPLYECEYVLDAVGSLQSHLASLRVCHHRLT